MTARIIECTVDEYHKDPCASPSLNRSIAQTLVTKSPAHAYMEHPKLGGRPVSEDEEDDKDDKEKKALMRGTVIHKLLLGKGKDLAVIKFDSYRSNAAKEAREEAIAAGQTPIKVAEFDGLLAAASRIRDSARALGFDFKGASEVAVEWTEQGMKGPILCRTMWDHVYLSEGVIYEVKSIRNAHPQHIERTFYDNGYDIQHAVQRRAMMALQPQFHGKVEHHFLFMELKPPYVVTPAFPSGEFAEIGENRWRRALDLWEKCMTTQYWPGYSEGSPIVINVPGYIAARELENDYA